MVRVGLAAALLCLVRAVVCSLDDIDMKYQTQISDVAYAGENGLEPSDQEKPPPIEHLRWIRRPNFRALCRGRSLVYQDVWDGSAECTNAKNYFLWCTLWDATRDDWKRQEFGFTCLDHEFCYTFTGKGTPHHPGEVPPGVQSMVRCLTTKQLDRRRLPSNHHRIEDTQYYFEALRPPQNTTAIFGVTEVGERAPDITYMFQIRAQDNTTPWSPYRIAGARYVWPGTAAQHFFAFEEGMPEWQAEMWVAYLAVNGIHDNELAVYTYWSYHDASDDNDTATV